MTGLKCAGAYTGSPARGFPGLLCQTVNNRHWEKDGEDRGGSLVMDCFTILLLWGLLKGTKSLAIHGRKLTLVLGSHREARTLRKARSR